MEASLKRNIAKILMWGTAAWVGYKAVSGLANNKSPEKIIKETVEPVEKAAAEVKKVTKRLLKGSPEAKAYMANLRSKNKTPRGQGKRSLKKKSKAAAGKLGGEATAAKGIHKGHTSKRGLKQDQKNISKEVHEKHYRKSKKVDSYADGGVVKETGLALVHKGEVVIPKKDIKNDFLNNSEISEREVLLIMRRINSGKLKPQDIPHIIDGEGYVLSDSQIAKGKAWLIDQWKTPKGVERKNNPFGYREQEILNKLTSIRLKDVYSERGTYYLPLYEVEGDNTSFEYYVSGGQISIVG